MRIICASINKSDSTFGINKVALDFTLKSLKLPAFYEVFTMEQLQAELASNKDEEVILFSNFPPNSAYPESTNFVDSPFQTESYIADSYVFTSDFYNEINMKYKIKAVHVISGAPQSMLNSEMIKSIFSTSLVSLLSYNEIQNYSYRTESYLRDYIVEKIQESM